MLMKDSDGNELYIIYRKEDRKKGRDVLDFFSEPNHSIQCGIWCNYNTAHEIKPHRHNAVEKTVPRTQELFYVESGKILAYIYDNWDRPWSKEILHTGDILIQLSGGHTFEILEKDTNVIEVKNGPYGGKDVDKTVINVKTW